MELLYLNRLTLTISAFIVFSACLIMKMNATVTRSWWPFPYHRWRHFPLLLRLPLGGEGVPKVLTTKPPIGGLNRWPRSVLRGLIPHFLLDFWENRVYYGVVNRGLCHMYALQLHCTRERCRVFLRWLYGTFIVTFYLVIWSFCSWYPIWRLFFWLGWLNLLRLRFF